MTRRCMKKIAWVLMGLLLLELLLRTAGAAYLLLREHPIGLLDDSKRETPYIILCLGESTTRNGGAVSWPSQLESILNEQGAGRGFIVINEGMVGTNTAAILSRLESNLERYNPDMVITMMGDNDGILRVRYESSLESRIAKQLETVRLYRLGFWLWSGLGGRPTETPVAGESGGGGQDEQTLREQLELEPDNLESYVQLGWHTYLYREGEAQADPQRLRASEELFMKALEDEPDSIDAYLGLGWVYLDLGTALENTSLLEEAVRMFTKVIELDGPYEVGDWFTKYEGLGMTYEAQGNYQRAIETYETVVDLSHSGHINARVLDWTYSQLGWLYHETGMPDEEIGEFYRKEGIPFKGAGDIPTLEITRHHYRELYRMLDREGITYVAMQYPTRDVNDLKSLFEGPEDIIFVSNKENFGQALQNGDYKDYFIDRFAGTFGHATPAGNRLIAEAAADAVLHYLKLDASCDALGSSLERNACHWQRFLEERRENTLTEDPREHCLRMDSAVLQYICLRTMFRPHMIPFPSFENASTVAAMLAASDSPESRAICDSMDDPALQGECIFHLAVARVIAAGAGELSGELAEEAASLASLCGSISDRDWRAECYYLLADELALLRPVPDLEAIAEYCRESVDAVEHYGCYGHTAMLLPVEDAIAYCSLIDKAYQPLCAQKVGRNMEIGSEADFAVRGTNCSLFPPSLVEHCLTGVAQELGGACTENLTHSIIVCGNVPEPYRGECVTGASRAHVVLQNMVDLSPAIEGCKEYSPELQEFCFNRIIRDLIDTVNLSHQELARRTPEEARAWCGELPFSYKKGCLDALAVG